MRRCGYEYVKQLALLESVHVEPARVAIGAESR